MYCAMARGLMETEVSGKIGAEHGERSLGRSTHRNGYRPRAWDTRVGSIELAIPKLRSGSYFPSFLEQRPGTLESVRIHRLRRIPIQALHEFVERLREA
jgi:transposase-like protein